MLRAVLCLCLCLGLIARVASESSVVELDASNFDSFIENAPIVLVEFYAPWCGHCKALAPEYEAAAQILKDDSVKLAKVDAADEKNQRLAATHDVQGFPTLKLFKNKRASDYMGQRTASAIVEFMRKKSGPPTTYLESDGATNEFRDNHDVVVIGFFDDKNKEEYKAFEMAAGEVSDVHFGHVFDNGIRTLLRAEKNSVLLLKKFDEKRMVYAGEMNPKAIEDYVAENSMPLVIPFNEVNSPKIFGGKLKIHVIVFVDPEKNKDLIEVLPTVAAKHKGSMLFVTVSPAEEQITEYFGVSKDDMPAIRLVDMSDSGMKKYVFEEPSLNEASLTDFCQKFKDGNLTPTLKSEDEPAHDEGTALKVIVSKTWHKEVMESENDVLVKYYAPWCGHCKELAPKYEALATKLKPLAEKLVIAQINAEANEIVGEDPVEGFPTLRLYPAGNKNEPKEYTGERSQEAIEAWLLKEVTNKWTTEEEKAPEKDKAEL